MTRKKINHAVNMIAALECRQTETAVPFWELEFHAWDNLSGRHVILGNEFKNLSGKEQDIALHNNAEIIISTAKVMNYSAITEINGFWEVSPGVPAYYWLPPDARLAQNRLLKEACEAENMILVGICSANIGIPHSNIYIEWCYKLFDNPEEIDEIAKKRFQQGIEDTRKYAERGYRVLVSPTDIADSSGPFYNPEQMERWFYPYFRKWTEEIKKLGMYSILHSDGNLHPILKQIADTEVHGLQAIDPVAGMDIQKAKKETSGKLCLCGNVDTGLLLTGPKEDIYNAGCSVLKDCSEGGGYVFGTSNAVFQNTPAENYLELGRAWKEYGIY